jgi:hypothetical protein
MVPLEGARATKCRGCGVVNGPYINSMLHFVVIVALIGVAVVCHMIGTNNAIYRD